MLQGWLCFELIFVSFLFVETRGPTLEEIAKIFDGEEAEVARVDVNEDGTLQKEMHVDQVEHVGPEQRV